MFALITGASSGIGWEFAKLLARRNYNLIIVARRVHRLEKLKYEIEKRYPVQIIIKQCDLTDTKSCYKLYEEIKSYPVEVLINNAGFGKVGKFENISLEDELNMIQTNITALHILTKLFVQDKEKGYILNVASAAGFQPGPMMAAYGATKAYALNLSLAVNYELKKSNKDIHITTLCPGPVETEFNKVADADFNLNSITAKRCAAEALKGLFQKRDTVIPGMDMKVLRIGSKLAPTKLILPIEYHIQTKKTKCSKK